MCYSLQIAQVWIRQSGDKTIITSSALQKYTYVCKYCVVSGVRFVKEIKKK